MKMCTKIEGDNSQMDKVKCAQRHKERTHRWTKKNVHKDTRKELTDGQMKMCTKIEGENSQMDKGKCAQRRKERTQRWTKENVHKDARRELKD
jgi:hypothetical protein